MLNTLEKIFMIVTGGEFIIGILGNGFIGLTNCIAWIRNRKLCLVDFILTSLAFARISKLWLTIVNLVLVLVYQEIPETMKTNNILTSIWILANHLTTWLAACLAVFYFLKISSFSHPLFLWLKWRINKVIYMVLLSSLPFLLISFPLPVNIDVVWYHVQKKYERNMTGLVNVSKSKHLRVMIVFIIGSFPPFSLSLISFFLLLFSLWRHTKHNLLNFKDSRDPSMEAHIRAMKTVFLFLVLFAVYQLSIFMTFWGYFSLQNKLVVMFAYMIEILYPSGHSYVVIFGNSQMRKAFLGFLCHLKCDLKGKALSALPLLRI
uniref:Taste receptor type 2 n=1 Tax=Equus asinus TaxID=9793 RepID=A0A9L0KCQ8_EQUAS